MSKAVKNLLINDLRSKLQGVNDCLLVNVIGLNSEKTSKLRAELRKKNIQLQVIKNSMARRAAEGMAIAPAFDGLEGSLAIVWGSEDVVSLAKEVVRLAEAKEFQGLEPRGGAIEGAKIPAAQVKIVSTWPSRSEQLSILVGQILGPGSKLAGQLIGAGGTLAGQIKQKIEDLEKAAGAPAETAAEEPTT
ncbi:MAG: 50S ribosomal protein L10 [Pirellulales bacterium]